MRSLTYTIIADVMATGTGMGRGYRRTINERWKASPLFRRLLRQSNLFWGCSSTLGGNTGTDYHSMGSDDFAKRKRRGRKRRADRRCQTQMRIYQQGRGGKDHTNGTRTAEPQWALDHLLPLELATDILVHFA